MMTWLMVSRLIGGMMSGLIAMRIMVVIVRVMMIMLTLWRWRRSLSLMILCRHTHRYQADHRHYHESFHCFANFIGFIYIHILCSFR